MPSGREWASVRSAARSAPASTMSDAAHLRARPQQGRVPRDAVHSRRLGSGVLLRRLSVESGGVGMPGRAVPSGRGSLDEGPPEPDGAPPVERERHLA